jgi:hypothetical protein
MNPAQHTAVFLLRVYQRVVSPVLRGLSGPAGECRFIPSCSEYACEAVAVHGVAKGGALAARRLCRCHPWGGCGEDPVPPRAELLNLKTSPGAGTGRG